MEWRILFIFAFLRIAEASPLVKNIGKIVGGENIEITSAKYQVSLQIGGTHFCGGSLISNRHVLTAAHCIEKDVTVSTLSIRLGSTDSTSGGDLINVIRITVHERFTLQSGSYDAAIVVLARVPKFDQYPIKIVGVATFEPNDGEYLFVTGWGATIEKGKTDNQFLKGVILTKVNNEKCKGFYAKVMNLTEVMFCAGFVGGGKGTCQGDSGGPITADGVLVGIVSWGVGCARARFPGVFTKVAFISSWIRKNTNTL